MALGHGTITRRGRHWIPTLDGREAIVADRLGMTYLARLLTSPGTGISALELTAGTGPETSALSVRAGGERRAGPPAVRPPTSR